MPMTAAREEIAKNAGTTKIDKNGEDDKNSKNEEKSEYLGTNLIQVSYIQNSITFQKKSLLTLFD